MTVRVYVVVSILRLVAEAEVLSPPALDADGELEIGDEAVEEAGIVTVRVYVVVILVVGEPEAAGLEETAPVLVPGPGDEADELTPIVRVMVRVMVVAGLEVDRPLDGRGEEEAPGEVD